MTADELDQEIEQFLVDRDTALLSMHVETLLAYIAKWLVNLKYDPNDPEAFWGAVHMARTGARSLPLAERIKSKQWLEERKLRHMGDDL